MTVTYFCQHDKCEQQAQYCCEICDRRFCSDHGTRGGDHLPHSDSVCGEVAYPSVCWNCGGFSVDEE